MVNIKALSDSMVCCGICD